MRCGNCGAFCNPGWSACFVCGEAIGGVATATSSLPRDGLLINTRIHGQSADSIATDNRLPLPDRQRLYALQNALVLRLERRLDRFIKFTGEPAVSAALDAWAGSGAMEGLYTGCRTWPEQRRLIFAWAQVEFQAIRYHRDSIEERAAIMEFDGGLDSNEAEEKATLMEQ